MVFPVRDAAERYGADGFHFGIPRNRTGESPRRPGPRLGRYQVVAHLMTLIA